VRQRAVLDKTISVLIPLVYAEHAGERAVAPCAFRNHAIVTQELLHGLHDALRFDVGMHSMCHGQVLVPCEFDASDPEVGVHRPVVVLAIVGYVVVEVLNHPTNFGQIGGCQIPLGNVVALEIVRYSNCPVATRP
jgi:hypothetical protein